jgi:hypothetical protein
MIRTTNTYDPAHDLSLQTRWKTGEEAWHAIWTRNDRMRPILSEGQLVRTYFGVLHACLHRISTASYALSCMSASKTDRRVANLSTRKGSPLLRAISHVGFSDLHDCILSTSTFLPSLWSYYTRAGLHRTIQPARLDRNRRQRRVYAEGYPKLPPK